MQYNTETRYSPSPRTTDFKRLFDKKSKEYTKLLSKLDEDSTETRNLRDENRALHLQISQLLLEV